MTNLSVIIITKNEAKNIQKCLESVQFADEIIVVDSGSTDDTLTQCRSYTDKIFIYDWPGYGPQKNRALSKASCEWVFSIDADEVITPDLKNEILTVISIPSPVVAYSIPRFSNYCGRYLRFGDWKNDRCIRLFKKEKAKFKDAIVHEHVQVQGEVGKLNSWLLHESFADFESVLKKVNEYSSLSAKMHLEKKAASGLLKAIMHGMWTFIRSYFIKLGFLDGREGFMLAFSNAEGCYYRYLKLWHLQKSQKKED